MPFVKGHTSWKKGKKDSHHSKVMKNLYKIGKMKPIMMKGKDNPAWKGDKVGYHGLHKWIEVEKGKAKYLYCSKYDDGTCKGRLEWSNISQKYLRKVNDWWVLCASHHKRYDNETPATCRQCNEPHRSSGFCKRHYYQLYYLKTKNK